MGRPLVFGCLWENRQVIACRALACLCGNMVGNAIFDWSKYEHSAVMHTMNFNLDHW